MSLALNIVYKFHTSEKICLLLNESERRRDKVLIAENLEHLVLDVQTPTLNLSKQNFRNSSQYGLLNTATVSNSLVRN